MPANTSRNKDETMKKYADNIMKNSNGVMRMALSVMR